MKYQKMLSNDNHLITFFDLLRTGAKNSSAKIPLAFNRCSVLYRLKPKTWAINLKILKAICLAFKFRKKYNLNSNDYFFSFNRILYYNLSTITKLIFPSFKNNNLYFNAFLKSLCSYWNKREKRHSKFQ